MFRKQKIRYLSGALAILLGCSAILSCGTAARAAEPSRPEIRTENAATASASPARLETKQPPRMLQDVRELLEKEEVVRADGKKDEKEDGGSGEGDTDSQSKEPEGEPGREGADMPPEGEPMAIEDAEEGIFLSVVPSAMASQKGDNVTLVKGKDLYYPASLGNYMTNLFYVNGKIAYCLESQKASPPDADYVAEVLNDNENVQKCLYYGYGGPGDLTETFMPGYDEDTKYIFTHIAASYAYTGIEGFHGCTMDDLEAAGVLGYIDFLCGQKNPPVAAISLSPDYQEAYLEGGAQRTGGFELVGDHRNYVTLDVPEKVTLHDVTNKKESTGGSAKICGGTSFYLSAPKSVTGTWDTGNLRGQIGSQWKTLVISTGNSTQDIGYGDFIEDEANAVKFTVRWMDIAKISLTKRDGSSNAGLAGAVFGVYSDTDCKHLITEMPPTNEKGHSSTEIEKMQETVYLKEITAPKGYVLSMEAYNVKLVAGGNTEVSAKNKEVRGEVHVKKIDRETNGFVSQGDASLAGAEYSLFAAEDIRHPDGKSGTVHKKGELVTQGVISPKGTLDIAGLYLGKYILKETKAGEGYLLDPTEYPVDIGYEGQDVKIVHRNVTVKETVKKQAFELIKVGTDGEQTEADLLEGAGFKVYLIRDLKGVKDGTIKPDESGRYQPKQFRDYDFSGEGTALNYSGDSHGVPMKELFTDKKGYARSRELAYGKYVVIESTVPKNYNRIDPFIVDISDDSREPQQWRVFIDYKFMALLKIYKIDGTSMRPVLHAGATFKIYDLDKKEYVSQHTHYPTLVEHTEFATSDAGYLITPEKLPAGRYRIEEIRAPEGYVKADPVEIDLSSDAAHEVEPETGAIVIKMQCTNERQTGTLRLSKKGEKLAGYEVVNGKSLLQQFGEFLRLTEKEEDVYDFKYAMGSVEGAEFSVFAAEDICTPDYQVDADGNRNVIYYEGDLAASLKTDKEGAARAEGLPLGRYRIVETVAGNGFVLNKEIQEFELKYAGDETEVVFHDSEYVNERQKVFLTINKKDKDTGKPVGGAVFGLFAEADIAAVDGSVLVPADAMIESVESDGDGIVRFTKDLPITKYYVKELCPAPGYVLNEETIKFDLTYMDQEEKVVEATADMENDHTKVEVSKVDVTGKGVTGAALTVKDGKGKAAASWVTDGTPHRIDRLMPGRYTLVEEKAPKGFETAEDVAFTVSATGEIQKVTMVDEYEKKGKVFVQKVGDMLTGTSTHSSDFGDIYRLEYEKRHLPGVEFTIYDRKGDVADIVTTEDNGAASSKELPLGKYTMKETKTPAGLAMNHKTYEFELKKGQDNKVVDVSMDIENDVVDAEINVFKVGEMLHPENGTFGYGKKPLEGVYFGIYTNEDLKDYKGGTALKKDSLIGVIKTNKEGKATLKAALVSGRYYYKELRTLEGYLLDEDRHEFELVLKNDPVTVFNVNKENPALNRLMKAKVTLMKVDASDESKKLAGAEFELFSEEGEGIGMYETDSDGEISIPDLPYGRYYFRERKAPEGYQKLVGKIEFSMEGKDVTIYCKNHVVPKLGFEDGMLKWAIGFSAAGLCALGGGFCIYYGKKKKKEDGNS